ncbi:NADPH-dependent F420 reductase [Brenneria goodwinii]|uniref:NADPH-dependent F420 reductase n=1 Tax=Brenneria goodwinii TaxID=1109412 RepID=UPI0036ED27DE
MNIGIIGAGFIGRGVAELAIKAGHKVMLSNSRGPEKIFSTLRTLKCEGGTVEQAAAFGDLVLVAIPFNQLKTLPADALQGKVVMDANNYYPDRDGRYPQLDNHETTTSEMLALMLPGAKVVKAFNAIYAKDLLNDARTAGATDRRALPIAGDDAQAKRQVAEFLHQVGFDSVDAGALAQGWRFERDTPCYCVPLNKTQLVAKLAQA